MAAHERTTLNQDQVALALQNVSHIFGDDVGSGDNNDRNTGALQREPSYITSSRRPRLDSSNRPSQFADKAKKGKLTDMMKVSNSIQTFREHGINEGALRHRMESKAVDPSHLERVRTDFGTHDKLSHAELSSLETQVHKAHKLHLNGDPTRAESIFVQVLEADPVNYDCLSNLAKIAYSRGELQKAHDLFERAIVVRPQHDKTVYHLAVVLYDMEELERSKALFEEVVHGYKGENKKNIENEEMCDTRTYHNSVAMLGLIHLKMKDFEKSRILIGTVLKEDPDHILGLDHKCALLATCGEKEEAAKLHRRLCDLDSLHTKKTCPYLDALFPSEFSTLYHEQEHIDRKIIRFEKVFAEGARKKSWTNHPWRSLTKKITRMMGNGPPPI